MPLSLNEIKDRALAFSREWENAEVERAEAQTFWNEFFNVCARCCSNAALSTGDASHRPYSERFFRMKKALREDAISEHIIRAKRTS